MATLMKVLEKRSEERKKSWQISVQKKVCDF